MHRRSRSLLAVVLATLLAAPAVLGPAPAAALSCGPCPAVAVEQVNLRTAPSLDSEVILPIPAGARLVWDVEPASVDGYVPVVYAGISGWAHDDYLLLYPAWATTLAAVNQREAPTLDGPVVGVLPAGTPLILLDGPVVADGHAWYRVVDQAGGTGGWAAGDFLDLALR